MWWLKVLISRVTATIAWSPVCLSSNKQILMRIQVPAKGLALTPVTAADHPEWGRFWEKPGLLWFARMTLPAVILRAAAKVVVQSHGVHQRTRLPGTGVRDLLARCRGHRPARPYSGSKTPNGCYSLRSPSRAQSEGRQNRSWAWRGEQKKLETSKKKDAQKAQRRPGGNQEQRKGSKRQGNRRKE